MEEIVELTSGAEATQQDVQIGSYFFDLDGNMGKVLDVKDNSVMVKIKNIKGSYPFEVFQGKVFTEKLPPEKKIIELNCLTCPQAKKDEKCVYCKRADIFIDIDKAHIECAARGNNQKSKVKEVWNVDEYISELIALNKLYEGMDNVSEDMQEVRNNVMDKILFNNSFKGKINKLARKYYEILKKKFGNSDFRHIIRCGIYTQMRTYGLIDMKEIDKPVAHLYHYLFKQFQSGRTRVDSYLINMLNRPNTNESSIYHPEKKEFKSLVTEELTFNQNNKFENMTEKQSQGARSILKFSVCWRDYRFKSYKENKIIDTEKYSIQYGFDVKKVTERLYDYDLDLEKYKKVCKDKFKKWEKWGKECKKKETIVYIGRVENEVTRYLEDKILLLESEQQQVINLYYFDNMKLEEIKSKIATPTSTIDRWKSKGLNKLKEIIVNDKVNIINTLSHSVLMEYV